MGIDDESSHPGLGSEVAGGVTGTIVCLFQEPDAGNPPVRFDEREQETESSQTGLRRRRESFVSSHRETKAPAPVLDSTHRRLEPRAGIGVFSLRSRLPQVKKQHRIVVWTIVVLAVIAAMLWWQNYRLGEGLRNLHF